MSEVTSADTSMDIEKPVQANDAVIFPPFPDPEDIDFEDDIGQEEREYYKSKFPDLHMIKDAKLHCSACDRHLGCAAVNENRMRMHPMLRTLVCNTCHTFYNSGEFEKGEDGSELYCRWCGQGGQVYCCSACPHVFCAKCIKRNLGIGKIKEIENTDDWKCFKCIPGSLWDLRAICWALLRYCDIKNKLVYKTVDPDLKEKYQKDCSEDHTDINCCKKRGRPSLAARERPESNRKVKEEIKKEDKKASTSTQSIISKIPATIQVKKFASINLDDEKKKPQKRSASPKSKPILMKNPIAIAPYVNSPNSYTPPIKKMKFPAKFPSPASVVFSSSGSPITYNYQPRKGRPVKANVMHKPPLHQPFNGYSGMLPADNINLSLESLTQGLDMAAVAAMNNQNNFMNDDVVCTPDFPMEPLCEVFEDNNDDDVQCITPDPVAAPRRSALPALSAKPSTQLPDLSPENIIQMTDNDVTVNALTGGLKFRVDPQTLSANKMYRLPDGRIFAINSNPSMPGGYSATIVAVTENGGAAAKPAPAARGATYAAKLSAVGGNKSAAHAPPPLARIKAVVSRNLSPAAARAPPAQPAAPRRERAPPAPPVPPAPPARRCDMDVPVEWYRYNVIDAVDSLEYSLARLRKLKRDASTVHLRTRTAAEMRALHHSLERLLLNSAARFREVSDNLHKGYKSYLQKKRGELAAVLAPAPAPAPAERLSDDEEDDDVEILANENEDPIFIDENSLDSEEPAASRDRDQDVEEIVSSDLNESGGREAGETSEAGAAGAAGETSEAGAAGETDGTGETSEAGEASAAAGELLCAEKLADGGSSERASPAPAEPPELGERAATENGDGDEMDVSGDTAEGGRSEEERDKGDGDKGDDEGARDTRGDDAQDDEGTLPGNEDDAHDETAATKNNSNGNSDVAPENGSESTIADKISEVNDEKVIDEKADEANDENHLLKENNESVPQESETKHDSDFDEDLLESLLKDDVDDVTSAQKNTSLESDSLTA